MKGRYEVQYVDQSGDTILVVETSTGDTRLIAARELTEMLRSGLAVRVKTHRPSKPFYEPFDREATRREFESFLSQSIQNGAGSVLSKRSCPIRILMAAKHPVRRSYSSLKDRRQNAAQLTVALTSNNISRR
jgi:hypothetical protein